MQEERRVTWILIVSLVSLYISTMFSFAYYPLRDGVTTLERVLSYISRIDTLLFVATITTATVFTTGLEKKDLIFKVSVYLFIISMALFFVSILRLMFFRGY